jgi:transcriptional regulator with XRE-family HTH domain
MAADGLTHIRSRRIVPRKALEPPQIGIRILHLRKRKHLTLEQLAKKSGISRSMLSQIERGAANPTFATLWSLTRALDIDFAMLTGAGEPPRPEPVIEKMGASFTPSISSPDGKCTLQILGPLNSASLIEWYDLRIEPGAVLHSAPHAPGAIEHLTLTEGDVRVRSGVTEAIASTGETLRYPADLEHEIANTGSGSVHAFLVVILQKA